MTTAREKIKKEKVSDMSIMHTGVKQTKVEQQRQQSPTDRLCTVSFDSGVNAIKYSIRI